MQHENLNALSAQLEQALVRALLEAWRQINYQQFKQAMRPPQLALSDSEVRLGQWDAQARCLTLSRKFVLESSWPDVIEVLKHEVAHQFVSEVLQIKDEPPHGPTFQSVCVQRGIDPTAAGPVKGTGTDPHPIFRRIAKLLALAESPNLNEAELAMKQAQRLMLKHNIDAATAQLREGYNYRHVGVAKARRSAAEKALTAILERFFFVAPIWVPYYIVGQAREAWILELCGTPSNLDVAAWVHDFLLETGERLWLAHKRQRQLSGNAERRQFLYGVMNGFEAKLAAGMVENRQEGLVWRGDAKLQDYLHRRYPRRRTSYTSSHEASDAYLSGHRAGREIILSRPVSSQSSSHGRLLGSAK